MTGVAVAVLVVLLVVTAYLTRRPREAPRGWRGPAAVSLTVAAVAPLAWPFGIAGRSWMGRGYHCGDGLNIHFANTASAVTAYGFLIVAPALFCIAATVALLRLARRLWFQESATR